MESILLSPHNDDETLFAAFTLMREKPLVLIVTDGFIQAERGDPITWSQRRMETTLAMQILGCKAEFLGIRDTELTEEGLIEALERYSPYPVWQKHVQVYAPALQGGNRQHDLVSKVAQKMFPNLIQYTTYTKTELWTKGSVQIVPTREELELKDRALDCYRSQILLSATRPHFNAVRGKSEWYL